MCEKKKKNPDGKGLSAHIPILEKKKLGVVFCSLVLSIQQLQLTIILEPSNDFTKYHGFANELDHILKA